MERSCIVNMDCLSTRSPFFSFSIQNYLLIDFRCIYTHVCFNPFIFVYYCISVFISVLFIYYFVCLFIYAFIYLYICYLFQHLHIIIIMNTDA